ncbi:MAG: kelch repeat-containing protein [Bacteroidota bacterium]
MNQRKSLNTILITALFLSLLTACSDSDLDDESDDGNWIERSDFEGLARASAVSFTINDMAYVGTGYTGEDYLKDFWEYDSERNFWRQKASMPAEASARSSAVAFSANGKGYVGTGFDGEDELSDFWAYNPGTNTWDSIAPFGGTARYAAVAFEIDDIGYVCTGFDGNDRKDLWAYNPATDEWTQKVSIGGSKRRDAVAFVIDGRAYVGTGRNNGVLEFDFWEYDPIEDRWAEKAELDEDDDYTIARYGGVAFSANGLGYITTGTTGSQLNDTWEYNPVIDEWIEKTRLDGSSRVDAVSFTLNDRPYIVTGRNGNLRLDDIWEFEPDEVNDEDD